jgi:hypothetical protein
VEYSRAIFICTQEVRYGSLQNETTKNSQNIAALQVKVFI